MCLTTELQTCAAKLFELQGGRNKSSVIIGDFNIPLLETDESNRQKISKDIIELNSTTNQLYKCTSIDYFIQRQQNTHSSQAHMEHSPT